MLDEFALILHMSDVYWSQEGRLSVEMVSLAVACMGLVLVGFDPISFSGAAGDNAIIAALLGVGLTHLVLIVTCVLKGKYEFALLGAFVPLLALICSLRMARPDSLLGAALLRRGADGRGAGAGRRVRPPVRADHGLHRRLRGRQTGPHGPVRRTGPGVERERRPRSRPPPPRAVSVSTAGSRCGSIVPRGCCTRNG